MAEKEKRGFFKQIAHDELQNAPKAFLDDLFENYYGRRHEIYVMNFVRGIFFGFGSLIGGTLVVALLLAILSFFEFIPFLNEISNAARNTLQK